MRMKPISMKYKQQQGFSLLEALLSIVIILAAGLGVVELFISADKKNKLQTTEQIAQQVASAAAQLLSSTYDPEDTISTTDVINSGLLAQNVIVGSTIKGPYGTFVVDSLDQGTHEQFTVTVNDLPYDQAVGFCQNMIGNFAILGTETKGTMLTKVAKCADTFKGTGSDTTSLVFGYPRSTFSTGS